MEDYEINKATCAIISMDDNLTKVIEGSDEYLIKQSTLEIMENSCEYYGSSIDGRIKGTKNILGSNYKLPVLVEEYNEIIFFPTSSYTSNACSWFSLKNIKNYHKEEAKTKVIFDSGKEVVFDISINSFENQLLRASMLYSVIRKRINK